MSLPHIHFPKVGPLNTFGILVATGVIVGNAIARRQAIKLKLPMERYDSLILWMLISGFVLSHMLDTIFYHPQVLMEQPWELFMIHHGLSSFGGFIGAAIGFLVYTRRFNLDPWRHADAIGYGLSFGWLFGRMGCSVVHDHPGRLSNAWYAVGPGPAWPGVSRLDLGLIELAYTPVLIAAVMIVGALRDRVLAREDPAERKRWITRPGVIIATLTLAYAPVRFALDFFRVEDTEGGDKRYFGLTPGHYAAMGFLVLGLYLLFSSRNRSDALNRVEEPKAPEPTAEPKKRRVLKKAAAQNTSQE